jgi:hypothetical protein
MNDSRAAMLDRSLALVKQCQSELGEVLLKGHDPGFQAGKSLDQVRRRSGGSRQQSSSRTIGLCLVCRPEFCLLLS